MKNPPKKVLIVGPAWVGDMVMVQSLFISLKQCEPDSRIDVLAPAWSEPLLKRMPEVDRSVVQPTSHGKLDLGARIKLGKRLRANRYTQAIIIPRSLKAAIIPFVAKIPVRTGYRGEMRFGLLNDIRKLDKLQLTQTVQRYVALGQPPGIPLDIPLAPTVPRPRLEVDQENQAQLLRKFRLTTAKPMIALMPGAEYGPSKQWPLEYYGKFTKHMLNSGYQVWIFGSRKDRGAGKTIQNMVSGNIENLCGETKLEDVVDLLPLATAAVSNDSGLMHIAAAVGTNLVAIYGSSTPEYTPPLSDKAVVIYDNLACSPCFNRQCRFGHLRCMTGIKPDRVIQAVEKIMIHNGADRILRNCNGKD